MLDAGDNTSGLLLHFNYNHYLFRQWKNLSVYNFNTATNHFNVVQNLLSTYFCENSSQSQFSSLNILNTSLDHPFLRSQFKCITNAQRNQMVPFNFIQDECWLAHAQKILVECCQPASQDRLLGIKNFLFKNKKDSTQRKIY